MQRICVIAPCYNEEAVIELFYQELMDVLNSLESFQWEILFVDDGSNDNTLQLLTALHEENRQMGFLSLSRNFGHQIALTAGLDHVAADAVIMMDCDLQHPPELIPQMIAKWQAGADIVSTIRMTTENTSFAKKLISAWFYRLINFLSDTPIRRNSADFVLMSLKSLKAFQSMPERHRFLRGMISWIGFEREFIEFQAPARAAGNSKYSWRKMIGLGLTAVYSFSAKPLRLAIRVGLLTALFGLLYLVFVLWNAIFRPENVQPGWASVIAVILVMSGVQLVFTGLIGEYIARLYEEAKQRPLYLLKHDKRARQFSNNDN